MTDLERIKAKHKAARWDGRDICTGDHSAEVAEDKPTHPCDVVKLALALDFMLLWAYPIKGTPFWTCCEEARRTLREVANG